MTPPFAKLDPGFYADEHNDHEDEELDEKRKRLEEELAALLTAFLFNWRKSMLYWLTLNYMRVPSADEIEEMVERAVNETLASGVVSSVEELFRKISTQAAEDAILAASGVTSVGSAEAEETATEAVSSAVRAAVDRASEMFGLKRDETGQLVVDPSAQFSIVETTIDRLNMIMSTAEPGTLMTDLESAISAAVEFSTGNRAKMIARTELGDLWAGTQIEVYDALGIEYAIWKTSGLPNVCPVCLGNQAAGPVKLGNPYPSGDVRPLAHPNCACVLIPVPPPEGQ